MGLTPKQARFVEEYLCDLNATQAAIRAGYSAKTAEQRARAIWERDLETYRQPASGLQVRDRLADYIARATAAGGAPPME